MKTRMISRFRSVVVVISSADDHIGTRDWQLVRSRVVRLIVKSHPVLSVRCSMADA